MKTVFILGAGSSAELNYPGGPKLKERILTLLEKQNDSYKFLSEINSYEAVDDFVGRLRNAPLLPDTIDEFLEELHSVKSVRNVGRQAVALAISYCESDNLHGMMGKQSWHHVFANYLRKNRQFIDSESFSFVTFNYDISLEHFLHASLTAVEVPHEILTRNFLDHSNLVHLHGQVGRLSWMKHDADFPSRKYGERIPKENLHRVASRLLFPHEELDSKLVGETILNADCVVLLGFGFHDYNLKRIFFDELIERSIPIFATTFEMGKYNPDKLETLTENTNIRLFPMPCQEFMTGFVKHHKTRTLDSWYQKSPSNLEILGYKKIGTK